jgi:predicted nucleic acid-binding protein
MTCRYLLDSSAVRRLTHQPAAERVALLAATAVITTCGVVELGLLNTLPDPATLAHVAKLRSRAFTWLPTLDTDLRHAIAVQADILNTGCHVAWPNLITAAVAEREQATLLHHNADFDLIAKITDQHVEWLT